MFFLRSNHCWSLQPLSYYNFHSICDNIENFIELMLLFTYRKNQIASSLRVFWSNQCSKIYFDEMHWALAASWFFGNWKRAFRCLCYKWPAFSVHEYIGPCMNALIYVETGLRWRIIALKKLQKLKKKLKIRCLLRKDPSWDSFNFLFCFVLLSHF